MKIGKIYFLFILILVLNAIYYYFNMTKFHYCKSNCDKNFYYIDIPRPNYFLIEKLEYEINNNGINLDGRKNNNRSQSKKINSDKVPYHLKKFYLNEEVRNKVSKIIGEDVFFADENDKYRIFARIYNQPGDSIDWHYDNNFTKGKRYTLIIPLIVDKGNTSEFWIKDKIDGKEKLVDIPIGKGVIYNGYETFHKITSQTKGNRRMVIIIPLYSNYEVSLFNRFRMKVRDIIFKTFSL